jgi:diguanylate cyclase (GGDEF)-like protein
MDDQHSPRAAAFGQPSSPDIAAAAVSAPPAPVWHSALWFSKVVKRIQSAFHCPDNVSSELDVRHATQLLHLFPIFGPLFSLAILLFSVWDFWHDAANAVTALAIRGLLVGIGALAYLPCSARYDPLHRAGFLYVTHACALILAENALHDGFLYGLSGVTSCLFVVAVMTMRPRAFFAIVTLPSVLLVALTVVRMPLPEMVNQLMLYLFALTLSFALMCVIRSFALQTVEMEGELLRLARRDSLTGVYNRGYLFELAEREVALASRHQRPLAVAMLDIDHFKRINDSHGHAVGDDVIVSLAGICMSELRAIDHFGRIGGEEFVCVMPETDKAAAMQCAERLRSRIEQVLVETPHGQIGYTVSIGLAMLGELSADWKSLLHAADCALYRAKGDGRNRVMLAL